MRTSSVITISLPPATVAAAKKIARKQQMTQSELFRTALRVYIEEQRAHEAIRIAETEYAQGKLKLLPKGGLVALMQT